MLPNDWWNGSYPILSIMPHSRVNNKLKHNTINKITNILHYMIIAIVILKITSLNSNHRNIVISRF